jgi:hypothetical protein
MVDVQRAVDHLGAALGRPVFRSGYCIVQRCTICDVELRLWDTDVATYAALFRRLFAFYDAHRCVGLGCTEEEAYERAERALVRMAEHALALQRRELVDTVVGEYDLPRLYERAERESITLAEQADVLKQRLRAA